MTNDTMRPVRDAVRTFNKHVLNPAMLHFAEILLTLPGAAGSADSHGVKDGPPCFASSENEEDVACRRRHVDVVTEN